MALNRSRSTGILGHYPGEVPDETVCRRRVRPKGPGHARVGVYHAVCKSGITPLLAA